jgi:hypothetical protein
LTSIQGEEVEATKNSNSNSKFVCVNALLQPLQVNALFTAILIHITGKYDEGGDNSMTFSL